MAELNLVNSFVVRHIDNNNSMEHSEKILKFFSLPEDKV